MKLLIIIYSIMYAVAVSAFGYQFATATVPLSGGWENVDWWMVALAYFFGTVVFLLFASFSLFCQSIYDALKEKEPT